jgi:L-fuconolactonase
MLSPRVDTHVHFWRYEPKDYPWIDDTMPSLRRDFLPQRLEPELSSAGFTSAVAVQARPSLEETRFLLDLADEYWFIAGVIGWIPLCAESVPTALARFAQHPKFLGVRHLVQDEPDENFLLRPDFRRGLALLTKSGFTYDLLIREQHLPAAFSLVAQLPEQTFVLDHLAKPNIRSGDLSSWELGLRRLASLPNVVCKLSGLVTEASWKAWKPAELEHCLDIAWDAFGPRRLLVGSDWPVCTLAAEYGRAVGVTLDFLSRFTGAEQAAVLGGNAARIWRLENTGPMDEA